MATRNLSIIVAGVCAVTLWLPAHAYEQKTPLPDTLSSEQIHLLDSIENEIAVPQCCNGPLATCLDRKVRCALAGRLHQFVKWLVARGTSPATIVLETQKRYESLISTRTSVVDTTVFAIAGDKRAPLLITGYVSATCPICHFVTHELYDAVTVGELKGKARLMVKPLGFGFANRSLAAANEMGRFWDFFIGIAKTRGRLTDELIYHVADSLKMSLGEFKRRISASEADACVKASTAEANASGITLAPSYFIDRVRYLSYKDPMWLIDAVECRYEALQNAK